MTHAVALAPCAADLEQVGEIGGEAEGKPQPLRSIFELAPTRFFGLMPGTLAAPHGFGAKVLSVFADPAEPGRSAHRGVVVLFDRVVVVPPSGSVTVVLWLSLLPDTPSR